MKAIGELVVYGANGVCKIEDLREETFAGAPRLYYILRPMAEQGNSRIFVPADNEKLVEEMKSILQPVELFALVQELTPFAPAEWPADGRARSKVCRELIATGGREQLIRLVKTVGAKTKKRSSSEIAACNRAASMLYQEFSLVLDLVKEDVVPFLLGQMTPPVKE